MVSTQKPFVGKKCTNDLTNEEIQAEEKAWCSLQIQSSMRSLFMCLIYHQSIYFSRITSVASTRQWAFCGLAWEPTPIYKNDVS